jgi:hypothetical protein
MRAWLMRVLRHRQRPGTAALAAGPDHRQRPMAGAPIGALSSRALVQYGPAPRVLTYAIMATVLALCATLMALNPETTDRSRGALESLRPGRHSVRR